MHSRSSSTRASRNLRSRQNSTTPAFTNSSRSTRGTTRSTAYSNESGAGTVGLLLEERRRREPAREVRHVRRAVRVERREARLVAEPLRGHLGDGARQHVAREAW